MSWQARVARLEGLVDRAPGLGPRCPTCSRHGAVVPLVYLFDMRRGDLDELSHCGACGELVDEQGRSLAGAHVIILNRGPFRGEPPAG